MKLPTATIHILHRESVPESPGADRRSCAGPLFKRMVEEDTDCPDVLVQIAAVRAALNSVGRLILEDHMQGCMVKAAQDGDFEDAFHDLKKSLDRFIG